MSANRVANEQMVSIPSFANVGAAQFDLNVTAANLMIYVASHVRRFNLNVTPAADDDKEAEEEKLLVQIQPEASI
nr:MADS-box protein FLOWERING LOCUS C-like [Ipomoea trifida]